MEDIDVQFKWFAKIHSVMGGTVVVNLPEVLDTLDHNGQCSSSAIPDTKGKQGEQVQHPSSLLSGEQEPSAQSGRQHLSAHRDEQPASAQNAEVPGPSGQRMESSCGIQSHKVAAQHGPQELPAGTNLLLLGHRHRIKQTQFDKMKKTNREMADLLLQASRSISSQAL